MFRRSRTGRRPAWWSGALLLALACLFPLPALEFTPAGGGAALRRLVYPGFPFTLEYTHSIFVVPVREAFTVDWAGRLVLREIWSTDVNIAGYYDIPGARVAAVPGNVRLLDLHLAHPALVVRGTPIGGRTYRDAGCAFPLAALAGEWGSVRMAVRVRPAVAYLWNGGGALVCGTP